MATLNLNLFDALVAALPLRFLEAIQGDLSQIYKEAFHAAHDNPLLERPEAEYLTPHLRRAIFEARFRKAATESGLEASVESNARNTASFTVVQAGNFLFTASYLNDPSVRPRHALFRSDFSALNDLLSQMRFREFDPHPIRSGGEWVYCTFVHGPSADDRTEPGFARFAFPNPENAHWVAEYDLSEVLGGARARQASPQVDNAVPKLKKKKHEGEGDG